MMEIKGNLYNNTLTQAYKNNKANKTKSDDYDINDPTPDPTLAAVFFGGFIGGLAGVSLGGLKACEKITFAEEPLARDPNLMIVEQLKACEKVTFARDSNLMMVEHMIAGGLRGAAAGGIIGGVVYAILNHLLYCNT